MRLLACDRDGQNVVDSCAFAILRCRHHSLARLLHCYINLFVPERGGQTVSTWRVCRRRLPCCCAGSATPKPARRRPCLPFAINPLSRDSHDFSSVLQDVPGRGVLYHSSTLHSPASKDIHVGTSCPHLSSVCSLPTMSAQS